MISHLDLPQGPEEWMGIGMGIVALIITGAIVVGLGLLYDKWRKRKPKPPKP